MRVLFYVGTEEWSASARIFLAAARGLNARGHHVTFACGSGTDVLNHVAGRGVETAVIDARANAAAATWEMRRVLQERFIEVAFVHTEREQLVASSAMRLAERGAVIRRIPPFAGVDGDVRLMSRAAAANGLLFSTDADRDRASSKGWRLPASVAPVGDDPDALDEIAPRSRASLGIPPTATLVACVFDGRSRGRLATVTRTLAALAPRYPSLHVVVGGPGASNDMLKLQAAAVRVGSSMTFLETSGDDSALLRSADLAWIAADGDIGALGCLDAMSLRLPVIIERSPFASHFVADVVTGVLVEPDSSLAAAAVADVLALAERRSLMGNAGRLRVAREFSEVAMVDGFEQCALAAVDALPRAIAH